MIRYRVALPHPARQEVEVALTFTAHAPRVLLHMPSWVPGSYLLREFARYAGEIEATGPGGAPLPIAKVARGSWELQAPVDAEVTLRYTCWCNELTVRTPHIDHTHAFFTGCNVLLRVEERDHEPHRLEVDAPQGWQVFCPLDPAPLNSASPTAADAAEPTSQAAAPAEEPPSPAPQGAAFVAPDYDRLADAQVECGPHPVHAFEVRGVPHRLILWGTDAVRVDAERLIADVTRIVEANATLFGGLPYPRYDFVFHVTDDLRGGLEHLNGTVLATPRRCFEQKEEYEDMLLLITHEHFHVWNGKRIRPAVLGPFDYEAENYTRDLWVVEGITSYMDELQALRAGCLTPERFLELLGRALTRYEQTPGRRVQSLADASFDAWIRLYRPDANSANRTVSYYLKGALVALCADLHVRRESRGDRSLDDLLRALWADWQRDGAGYPEGSVPARLEAVTGVTVREALERWVQDARAELPIEPLLRHMGLRVERRPADHPVLGLRLEEVAGDVVVKAIRADHPNRDAAIYPGDVLVALEGRRVRLATLADHLRTIEPMRHVNVLLWRREELAEALLQVTPPDTRATCRVVPDPDADEAARERRRAWLSGPPGPPPAG